MNKHQLVKLFSRTRSLPKVSYGEMYCNYGYNLIVY